MAKKNINCNLNEEIWDEFRAYVARKKVSTLSAGLEEILSLAIRKDLLGAEAHPETMSRGVFFSMVADAWPGTEIVAAERAKYIRVGEFLIYPMFKWMGDESPVVQLSGTAIQKLLREGEKLDARAVIVFCILIDDEVIVRAFEPGCLDEGVPKKTELPVFRAPNSWIFLRVRNANEVEAIKMLRVESDRECLFKPDVMEKLEIGIRSVLERTDSENR